jgi:GT2 family glycosyltransferase
MMISIIIINYKQKDYLLNCIKSIRENLKCEYEIIVVNNSSHSDSFKIENITVINNVNLGFAQANNLASNTAKGKYLFFMNADTLLLKDFSSVFLNEFENKDFGVVGISLRYPNGNYQLSYWYENNFMNEFKNKKSEDSFKRNDTKIISNYVNNDSVKEVDWVSGAAMIIKKDVFNDVKGFDEDFFLFYEDADICKRIKLNGGKIYYFPFDGLIHFKGENVNESFLNETYYHSKKSQLLYYKKHNNYLNRVMLRLYLVFKYSVKVIFERNSIDKRIFKLALGVSDD